VKFVEAEVRVLGNRKSPRVHEIKDFLARSRIPFLWFDVESDEKARAVAEEIAAGKKRWPIVLFPDGTKLIEPTVRDVAATLGLDTEPDSTSWDLIVVGGGPAGVSASIYGGSDGLRTLVVEQGVPGGQASYSASIENYPGFPDGLSGSELARRAVAQAERFGVEILVTRRATGLREQGDQLFVKLDDGRELEAHAVLLSVGVSFRWLDAPGCPELVGAGIYYGSATAEASDCIRQQVYVLGGGNSAGQAALLLAQYADRVTILTVEDTLEETMSKYLVDRIRNTPNIVVKTGHTVVGAEGKGHLEAITIHNLTTNEMTKVPCRELFVFIGARPNTEWLNGFVQRDSQGFVLSGFDCQDGKPAGWQPDRQPYPLETTKPGVFVAGDVRKGSVKRLTSAAGEGAMAAHFIYRYCASMRERRSALAQQGSS
jgi:thioredoxin reductase (NADPH)